MTSLEALTYLHPRSLKHLAEHLQALIEKRLWLKIIVAMVAGVGVGVAIGPGTGWVPARISTAAAEWLALPGQLFLGVIQMIVVPLVFASIVRGIAASQNREQLARLGTRLGVYFVMTTTVAVVIGLQVAYLIEPGRFVDPDQIREAMSTAAPVAAPASSASFPDLVRDIVPINPLGSMVEREMLQVVIFAVVVGVALVSMVPNQAQPMLELLGSLQEVCMTVVRWAMLLAPIAVFGLMARITSSIGLQSLLGMAVYVGTVDAGLHALMVVYLVLVTVVARRSPWTFLREVREVQLLAFSTSSSAAVMPLSIKTAEEKLNVRPSIAQFIVPLGATINMDGTALYQAVATVFLAQVTGVDLGFAALVFIVITAVGASIGAPSTPGVGIVLLAMVLSRAGIPGEAIALIIGVDRILDMCRTTVNVTGDLVASAVMDRWVGGEESAAAERAAQAARDAQREESGRDVIVEEPALAPMPPS